MAGARDFDRARFKELILYIADESADDPRFGATKLNKILYFADFKAFVTLGRSLTGATYRRMDRGPVPAEVLPVLQEMEAEGEIERTERRYFNYRQKVVRPLRAAELDGLLSVDEIELVRLVLRELSVLDAAQVSALSHLEAGWRLARDREVIPYESAYISARQPTLREIQTWREDIREHRAQLSG